MKQKIATVTKVKNIVAPGTDLFHRGLLYNLQIGKIRFPYNEPAVVVYIEPK